jgi:uncharacterized protein YndB with AHSA1/START domain
MELRFRTFGRIARPVSVVFEAVVDPGSLSAYFTTGGASERLVEGSRVTWDFADFPGAFPVQVVEVVENERIVLRWGLEDDPNHPENGFETEVTMQFTDCGDGNTLVEISEMGWDATQPGLDASYGNCMGWSQMICALKVWLEHGIRLRDGFYK